MATSIRTGRGPLGSLIFGLVMSAFRSARNGTLISDIVKHTLRVTSADKFSVVRLLDLHPTVNSSCISHVISLDEDREKGESHLPSPSTIYRTIEKVQKFGNLLLPIEPIPSVSFSCQFKPDTFFQRLLMTKDLSELLSGLQPSIAINTKCDGFPLMKYKSAV